MSRITKHELNERVHRIAEGLIEGVPEYKIRNQFHERYGLTHRQVTNYIKKARERIKPKQDYDIEEKRQLKIIQIERRIQSLDKQEARTARGLNAFVNAQKLIIELDNLLPTKKVALTNDKDNPLNITWEEIKTYGGESREDETS